MPDMSRRAAVAAASAVAAGVTVAIVAPDSDRAGPREAGRTAAPAAPSGEVRAGPRLLVPRAVHTASPLRGGQC